MTLSAEDYFGQPRPPRKKEPRYLAVIDKDSCTSCTACASVCPVDCIYEVVRPQPAASYHQIDTSRCIGCQLCYRIPSESTEQFTMTVCPWNAIDLIHNPNLGSSDPVLKPWYRGNEQDLPWYKLEEYAYQLSLSGEIRVADWSGEAQRAIQHLAQPCWGTEEDRRAIIGPPQRLPGHVYAMATEEGLALVRHIFQDYPKVFLD